MCWIERSTSFTAHQGNTSLCIVRISAHLARPTQLFMFQPHFEVKRATNATVTVYPSSADAYCVAGLQGSQTMQLSLCIPPVPMHIVLLACRVHRQCNCQCLSLQCCGNRAAGSDRVSEGYIPHGHSHAGHQAPGEVHRQGHRGPQHCTPQDARLWRNSQHCSWLW